MTVETEHRLGACPSCNGSTHRVGVAQGKAVEAIHLPQRVRTQL